MPKKPILPAWLSLALSITFVITGISVAIFVFLTAQEVLAATRKPFNPLEEAAIEAAGTVLPPLVQEGITPIETLPPNEPTPTTIPTAEPWQGDERVTFLLMGIDRRPGEPFISRTDTMMLVSINPTRQTASILSVPRDLYVVIPGQGRDRINTAFVYGSAGNNPAGGAALAMQTIEYNLGVRVNHYVMIDFAAFINAVDAIGGIDVQVPYDIYDPEFPDMNYGYDPLYIPAGLQHFDGLTALKYARTRHQDNDFYRAQRQQQVILAVRSKILGLGVDGFIAQAPFLYQQFQDGVRTDLSLEQMLQLVNILRDIPKENIRQEVLDYDYVISHTTEGGASVLVLINEKAATLIQELFYNN